jgi:hypothetical protein
MKTNELKTLIKEAVREVLKEELAELGKQKLNESIAFGRPYNNVSSTSTSNDEWPTLNVTTDNIKPAFKQSLMDQMGMISPIEINDNPLNQNNNIPNIKGNVYSDMLAQIANELKNNPAEINNFRNIG